jgi:hypothetical protein
MLKGRHLRALEPPRTCSPSGQPRVFLFWRVCCRFWVTGQRSVASGKQARVTFRCFSRARTNTSKGAGALAGCFRAPHGARRKTRGPSGSLLLSREDFASSASCRFIPAHRNRDLSTVTVCDYARRVRIHPQKARSARKPESACQHEPPEGLPSRCLPILLLILLLRRQTPCRETRWPCSRLMKEENQTLVPGCKRRGFLGVAIRALCRT